MGYYFSILISVVLRLIPHPANVNALGSLTLLNSKKYGLIKGISLVLITMIISDIFLGFNFATPFVYIGFMTYALFGQLKKVNPVATVLMGSVSFYLITNFGVFLGPWYEHNLAGLISCYVNALPFFRNTLVGDLVVVTVLSVVLKIFSNYNIKLSLNLRKELEWAKSLNLVNLKRR
jgi:hypothetical protein